MGRLPYLPTSFLNTRELALIRKLSKTNPTKIEGPHITMLASATETTSDLACHKFGLLFASCYY